VLIPKVSIKRVCVAKTVSKRTFTVAMSDPLLFSLVRISSFRPATGSGKWSRRGEILEAIQTGYPDKALVRAQPAGSDLVFGGASADPPAAADPASTPDASDQPGAPFRAVFGSRRPQGTQRGGANRRSRRSDREERHQGEGERRARGADGEGGVLIRRRLDGLLKIMELPKWVHEDSSRGWRS
jgi:hypothetical protein